MTTPLQPPTPSFAQLLEDMLRRVVREELRRMAGLDEHAAEIDDAELMVRAKNAAARLRRARARRGDS